MRSRRDWHFQCMPSPQPLLDHYSLWDCGGHIWLCCAWEGHRECWRSPEIGLLGKLGTSTTSIAHISYLLPTWLLLMLTYVMEGCDDEEPLTFRPPRLFATVSSLGKYTLSLSLNLFSVSCGVCPALRPARSLYSDIASMPNATTTCQWVSKNGTRWSSVQSLTLAGSVDSCHEVVIDGSQRWAL